MEEYAAQQRMGRAAVPGGAVAPTPAGRGGAGETMAEYAERVRAEKVAGTAQPSTAARMAAAAEEQGDGLADRVEGQVRFSFPYALPTCAISALQRASHLRCSCNRGKQARHLRCRLV